MKLKTIIWMMVFLLAIQLVSAWLNCTPSACPNGFTDDGINCSGSTCVRVCSATGCDMNWTQIYNGTCDYEDEAKNHESCTISSYTPSNTSLCYRFTYDATPDVELDVENNPSECDAHAIGGLFEGNSPPPGNSNPWFANMSDYMGNVGNSEFDYLLKMMRAVYDDAGYAPNSPLSQYEEDILANNSVYCAPNMGACSELGGNLTCASSCYNEVNNMYIYSGVFDDDGESEDYTLINGSYCGDNNGGATDYVDQNDIEHPWFYVATSLATTTIYSNQTCYRTNEAPNATNANVIPTSPTAGHDLVCNFSYSDPEDNPEKDSIYEWWKNGTNQNINDQILGKGNLTVGDVWYCKVMPSDGISNGTKVQSSNNVTILSTVKNPTMYLDTIQAWNRTGYYVGPENILNFESQLQSALANCQPDNEGYCNISITFLSEDSGRLNLSDLKIYYRDWVKNLSVTTLQELYSSGTQKIFEFVILNNGDYNQSDINWTLDTGESVINGTINSTLEPSNDVFMYVDYNYSSYGDFSVNLTVNKENITISKNITIHVGDLIISDFSELYSSTTDRIFTFTISNNGNNNLSNINWSLETGENIIYAQQLVNLQPSEDVFVYVRYNYTTGGDYNVIANVTDGTNIDSDSISISVAELDVYNLDNIYTDGTNTIFEFIIENYMVSSLNNTNWTLDLGDGTLLNSTQDIDLDSNDKVFVYVNYNYSGSGSYAINATARSGTKQGSDNISIII